MKITVLNNKTHNEPIKRNYPCLLQYTYNGNGAVAVWAETIILALSDKQCIIMVPGPNLAKKYPEIASGATRDNEEFHLNDCWQEFIGTIELTGFPGTKPEVASEEPTERKIEPNL